MNSRNAVVPQSRCIECLPEPLTHIGNLVILKGLIDNTAENVYNESNVKGK